jgi:MFS family permease
VSRGTRSPGGYGEGQSGSDEPTVAANGGPGGSALDGASLSDGASDDGALDSTALADTALARTRATRKVHPESAATESIGLEATRVGEPDFESLEPAFPQVNGDDAVHRGLRVVRQGAEGAERAAGAVYSRIQRVTTKGGAGPSGLAHVIEMSAVNSAGDLLVTLALANSLFFSVKPDEARTKVALYLLITMVPFTLLAPLIGPLLDRLRGGRRFAMALTALTRALLALVMARTISGGGLALYPAAFGCLAASKAYGVSRSAVIPRVLPTGTTLVRANSRISMSALAASTLATPIALGLGKLGPQWPLGLAALVYFLEIWLAIRLPKFVDSNEGEVKARLRKHERGAPATTKAEPQPDRRLRSVGPSVVLALRVNATMKVFSGFFGIFMAFLVRAHPIGGLRDLTAIGVIATAIAVGSGIGSALGGWLKARAPEAIVTASLAVAAVTAVVATFFYGLPMVMVLSGIAGVTPALAKLSLDALIQRDTAEAVRTSAFARSETLLQLGWVIGGALALPLSVTSGILGLSFLATGLSVMALMTAKSLYDLRWEQPVATSPA